MRVTNLVLCLDGCGSDLREATNPHRLWQLLDDPDDSADQLCWCPQRERPTRWRWRQAARDDAQATVVGAYEFLLDQWAPGDRIFLFGSGRGGFCALALARLLGTVGLLPDPPDVTDYLLATYALPRTRRTPQDWDRLTELAAALAGHRDHTVGVWFLGLFDVRRVPGVPRRGSPGPLPTVAGGRHAVAIDGPPGATLVGEGPGGLEEVWFRGAHRDVAGGPGACLPLADIALDWLLDGAIKAGLAVAASRRFTAPTPAESDALAANAPATPLRRPPTDAVVHASVEVYLRRHPQYWRRLPSRIAWTDPDWAARGERLAPVAAQRAPVLAAAS